MKTLTEQYILKSRSGVYQDTSENRRKHRVGQHYGEVKKEGEEGKLSKREQREARLASYKDGLKKLEDRLKEGGLSDSTREKIEGLRDTLKGKIAKLEARMNRKGQKNDEESKKDSRAELLKKVQKKVYKELDAFSKWTEDDWEDSDNFEEMEDRTERIAALIRENNITKEEWDEMTKPYSGGEISYDYDTFVHEEPKKDETSAEAGVRVFNSLPKEKQAILLNKLKEESERFLKDGMEPNMVIGEIEEYRDNNIDFDEEMADIARDLGVEEGEAYWAMKHAADLEIKRLEGLQKESGKKSDGREPSWDKQEAFFKKGTDEYKLLDNWDHYHRRRDPFYQREMQKIFEKKFPNIDEWRLTSPNTGRAEIRAIVDGKEVASINLNDASKSGTIPMLQTFMDKCQKAEKKKEDKKEEYSDGARSALKVLKLENYANSIGVEPDYGGKGFKLSNVTISQYKKMVKELESKGYVLREDLSYYDSDGEAEFYIQSKK